MATRKVKTSAELKQELEDAKRKVADLEKRAYANELTELLAATSIVADFQKIRANLTSQVQSVAILSAIANAVGLKRVVITMKEPYKRKPVDPNKPKRTKKSVK